jgi:hypothetical protein
MPYDLCRKNFNYGRLLGCVEVSVELELDRLLCGSAACSVTKLWHVPFYSFPVPRHTMEQTKRVIFEKKVYARYIQTLEQTKIFSYIP